MLDDEYVTPEPEYQPTALVPEPEPLHPWLAEFYDPAADMIFEPTELKTAEHALKKWIGIRPSNLERHNLAINKVFTIYDKTTFKEILVISWESCALCYWNMNEYMDTICNTCIIRKISGNECSDFDIVEGNDFIPVDTPWIIWVRTGDPEPMIDLLTKCVAALRIKSDKRESESAKQE